MYKRLFNKVLMLVCFLFVFLFPCAFCEGGDGSGGTDGTGGYEPIGGSVPYKYIGWKFSLAKRADVLDTTDEGIKCTPYTGLDQAGVCILFDPETKEVIQQGFDEIYYSDGQLKRRVSGTTNGNNYVTAQHIKDFFRMDSVDNLVAELSSWTDNDLYIAVGEEFKVDFTRASNYLNRMFSPENSTMLYKEESRRAFFRDFNRLVVQDKITEDEFASEQGILVVEPIVAAPGSTGNAGSKFFERHAITYTNAQQFTYLKWGCVWEGKDESANPIVYNYHWDIIPGMGWKRVAFDATASVKPVSLMWNFYNMYDLEGNKSKLEEMKHGSDVEDSITAVTEGDSWKYGFAVYGQQWGYSVPIEVDSKASANITVRASQNADGTYNTEAKASLVSQQDGTMPYDENLKTVPSSVDGLTGGGTGEVEMEGKI